MPAQRKSEDGMNRRRFLSSAAALGVGLVARPGSAGFLTAGLAPIVARAQTGGGPVRRSNRYEDTIISERKPFVWPGNKTLAVWVAPNVEGWNDDSPDGQAVSPNLGKIVPDVVSYAWREYGRRVGLWRIADVLDAAGVKATIALNSLVCEHYPKAMDEMKKRGWEFMGQGTTNSVSLAGLSAEKERETIRTILKTIEQSTGHRPRGWLGSGLAETYNTLDILAEEGVIYCGDWNNDDEPYPMNVKYRQAVLDTLLHGDQRHPALYAERLHRRAILPIG